MLGESGWATLGGLVAILFAGTIIMGLIDISKGEVALLTAPLFITAQTLVVGFGWALWDLEKRRRDGFLKTWYEHSGSVLTWPFVGLLISGMVAAIKGRTSVGALFGSFGVSLGMVVALVAVGDILKLHPPQEQTAKDDPRLPESSTEGTETPQSSTPELASPEPAVLDTLTNRDGESSKINAGSSFPSERSDPGIEVLSGILLGLAAYFIGRLSPDAAVIVTIIGGLLCVGSLLTGVGYGSKERSRPPWRLAVSFTVSVLLAAGIIAAWMSLRTRSPGPDTGPVVTTAPPVTTPTTAAPAPTTMPSNSTTIRPGSIHTIADDSFPGCTDRALFERLIGYAKDGDLVTFLAVLYGGVADGVCTFFDLGERVEVVQIDTVSGFVKVRRVGAKTEYWTSRRAIESGVALESKAAAETPTFPSVTDSFAPTMVLIPSGSFRMGDSFGEGDPDERPVHTVVYVSASYMDRYEVTKALWDEVAAWAERNGYDIRPSDGSGKGPMHPVTNVSWYEAVKWCNARSEKEGRTPCYYTDATHSTVYRTGRLDLSNDCVKWKANGYRLPTEAEWEMAARGGCEGRRFPWCDAQTITHSRANYESSSSYSYDMSPTRGYHPAYKSGEFPYTSPVGSFAPNGYGLYDMAGNVREWCWDWYSSDYYSWSPEGDPRGPNSGSLRVCRGGSWGDPPYNCRVTYRYGFRPSLENLYTGLRVVRTRP